MRISFLIPAYNERETICQVLNGLDALAIGHQAIIIDDGSTDGTADAVERWRGDRTDVIVLRQVVNRGKGNALRAGIAHISGEITVIQDADLEYDTAEVPSLVAPIVQGVADVVYGSRLSGGRPQRAYFFWHLVGNRFLTLLTGILFNTTISDMETGYKAFRTDVLRSLDLRQNDFSIEPEITAKVCLKRLRLYQVPISYYGRSYEEGKKITWRDGFKAVWVLLRIRVTGR